ncbi:MAG: DUF4276 family protein [Verrucomicrobia bacterium]|nr:DUF4276 family protein [Verrucomicrobiota bacterium]
MNSLRFTLVADGPSDAALLHPLRWLLVKCGVSLPLEPAWAELRLLPKRPSGLVEKIAVAVDLYDCDLIFVHRDAEREPREARVEEIRRAVQQCSSDLFASRPYVCVVPVRMTEAWFLFDEMAIRRAAGNPAGRVRLELPDIAKLEDLTDPKATLQQIIQEATELPRRRREKVSIGQALHRLAELIEDFSPLRRLPAFAALEADLRAIISMMRWDNVV